MSRRNNKYWDEDDLDDEWEEDVYDEEAYDEYDEAPPPPKVRHQPVVGILLWTELVFTVWAQRCEGWR
jgi:hypothetical protein